MRGVLTKLVPATVFLLLALGVTPALATHVQCGDVITQDTTLDSDVLGCPGEGIVIGADNITLDLGGHTLSGNRVFDLHSRIPGIRSEDHSGVTIQNGSIRDFDVGVSLVRTSTTRVRRLVACANFITGISLRESDHNRVFENIACETGERPRPFGTGAGIALSNSRNNQIDHNSTDRNYWGIHTFQADHNAITHNSVRDNYFQGIDLNDRESTSNRIAHNFLSGNHHGIALDAADGNWVGHNTVVEGAIGIVIFGSNHNSVGRNVVAGNGEGIWLCCFASNNKIDRNKILGNRTTGIRLQRPGIDVPGLGRDNEITQNSVLRNGTDGILVDRPGTVVERNVSHRNGDDGIDIDDPDNALRGNTANNNFDLGIEAVPGVTDGGGNRASGNGNPLQCLNVFCK